MSLSTITLRSVLRLLEQADILELSRGARQRLQWFAFCLEHGRNVSLTCRHFGIARSTFLRWIDRFDPRDFRTLEEQSRRPHRVRAPETDPKIVELIRSLRLEKPFLSKEDIVVALCGSHGVALSPSTVGRVIARNGFFFGDSLSHRMKRRRFDEATRRERDTRNGVTDEPRKNPMESPQAGEELGGAWKPSLGAMMLLIAAACASLALPSRVLAGESASYKLYNEFPNDGEREAGASTSYQLNENGITWHETPLASTSYRVQAAPAAVAASSSAAGGGAAPPSPSPAPAPSGGGRRQSSSVMTGDLTTRRSSSSSSAGAPADGSISSRVSSRARLAPVQPGETIEQGEPSVIPPADLRGAAEELVPGRTDALQSRYHYFHATEPICPPVRSCAFQILGHPAAPAASAPVALLTVGTLLGLFASFIVRWLTGKVSEANFLLPFLFFAGSQKKQEEKRKMHRSKGRGRAAKVLLILAGISLGMGALLAASPAAHAGITAPQKHVYNGHLLNSSGQPVTTAVAIRFSYWKSADWVSTDTTATGAINTGATNYAGWKETFTVTPDSNGYFSVNLGSGTALPSFETMPTATLLSLYLQVEVKPSASADTAYELLDSNASSATLDRSPVLSVPFSLNADRLDQRDTGTASGSIAVLLSGGLLPVSTTPAGTNRDGFTLDNDNSAASTVSLTFGQTLAKTLSFDIAASRFNFNDDVRIQGDLTVTGLINGVDISNLQTSTGALKVFSGGGLNVKVSGGSYSIGGVRTDYAGSSNVAVQANTTNYAFFTSTGLTVVTGGFPTDKSFIPLAEIVTNAGAVTLVRDRRALSSDDREHSTEFSFNAEFPNTSLQGDASNNVGQLYVSHDSINSRNFYLWTSTITSLQDYDVIARVTLPSDFAHWKGEYPLTVTYRSTSADAANNKMDITVFDTNGAPVTLSGSTTNLVSTSWATTNIEFTGSPTWTAGQDILVKFKLHSKSAFQMHLGNFKLHFDRLPKQN